MDKLILLLIVLIYLLFRPLIIVVFLVTVSFVFLIYKKNLRFLLPFLVPITFYLIAFSFFYDRFDSFDGQLWYLKRTLLLKEDGFVDFTNFAHSTYLAELFLGFIYKYLNYNFVTVSFFLFTITNAFLLYSFYNLLGFSKKSVWVTFLVMSAPAVFFASLFEFKIEPFLLFFVLLSLITFIKFEKNPRLLSSLLFGLLAGIAVLLKISVVPFYLALFFISFVKNILNKNYKLLSLLFLSCALFTLIFSLWVLEFGLNIPWTNINIYPQGHTPKVIFDKNETIYQQCLLEQKKIDFGQYIPNNSFLDFLMQPINYLVANGVIPHSVEGIGFIDPGLFVYLSIISFIPLVLLKPTYLKKPIFIATLLYMIYYFLTIRTVFWYLLFLFPILVVPLDEVLENNRNLRFASKVIFTSLGISYIFLAIATSIFVSFIPKAIETPMTRSYQTKKASELINTTEGLVFDTVPLFLTFVKDYDKRIVKDSLYFGYTIKSNEEIHKELLENEIKYIIVPASSTPPAKLFGCPLRHWERSKEHANIYGDFVSALDDFTLLYKIK